MKKQLLVGCLLGLASNYIHAQNIAGTVPSNAVQIQDGTTITVTQTYEVDSILVDIDNDGDDDFLFELTMGPTMIDGANMLLVKPINSNIEFLSEDGDWIIDQDDALYLESGDTIAPDSSSFWSTASMQTIGGMWGCMICPGPHNGQNIYLAYRNSGFEGWVEFSYDIASGSSIFVTLHSYAQEDMTASLQPVPLTLDLNIYPNPSHGIFNLEGDLSQIKMLSLYDISGRQLWSKNTIDTQIEILENGYYTLQIETMDGNILHKKLIRQN